MSVLSLAALKGFCALLSAAIGQVWKRAELRALCRFFTPLLQKSSVLSRINRPFPQTTLWHVIARKGVNNTIINGWIPFNSFRFCGVLVLCMLGCCHTVMANGGGHVNGAEPLLKLFYAFSSMTGQNVGCEKRPVSTTMERWTAGKCDWNCANRPQEIRSYAQSIPTRHF